MLDFFKGWGESIPGYAVDPLTDPRLAKVPFGKLKRFMQEKVANEEAKHNLFLCSTKFAIVSLAEDLGIRLDPILDEVIAVRIQARARRAQRKLSSSWVIVDCRAHLRFSTLISLHAVKLAVVGGAEGIIARKARAGLCGEN